MQVQFIIVFGSRWHFRPFPGSWKGKLNCPECAKPELMHEKRAFKAFTLYWWPLWRTEDGGKLVECQGCGGHFERPKELLALLSGEEPEPLAPSDQVPLPQRVDAATVH